MKLFMNSFQEFFRNSFQDDKATGPGQQEERKSFQKTVGYQSAEMGIYRVLSFGEKE